MLLHTSPMHFKYISADLEPPPSSLVIILKMIHSALYLHPHEHPQHQSLPQRHFSHVLRTAALVAGLNNLQDYSQIAAPRPPARTEGTLQGLTNTDFQFFVWSLFSRITSNIETLTKKGSVCNSDAPRPPRWHARFAGRGGSFLFF